MQLLALFKPFTVDPCKITAEVGLGGGKHSVIVRVIPDSKPRESFWDFNCKGAVIKAYANGMKLSDFFKMQ